MALPPRAQHGRGHARRVGSDATQPELGSRGRCCVLGDEPGRGHGGVRIGHRDPHPGRVVRPGQLEGAAGTRVTGSADTPVADGEHVDAEVRGDGRRVVGAAVGHHGHRRRDSCADAQLGDGFADRGKTPADPFRLVVGRDDDVHGDRPAAGAPTHASDVRPGGVRAQHQRREVTLRCSAPARSAQVGCPRAGVDPGAVQRPPQRRGGASGRARPRRRRSGTSAHPVRGGRRAPPG